MEKREEKKKSLISFEGSSSSLLVSLHQNTAFDVRHFAPASTGKQEQALLVNTKEAHGRGRGHMSPSSPTLLDLHLREKKKKERSPICSF